MGEVVNLRMARKRKTREAAKTADSNRPAPGVSKAERQRVKSEQKLAARKLDNLRRDGDGE